jgi:anti-sigma factor ChrR (cupin superfamily)
MTASKPRSAPNTSAMDPEIIDAIDAQQTDSILTPEMQERVRSRLMQRIAQDSTQGHTTVKAEAVPWRPFLPGIERKILLASGATVSYLLRLAPGAAIPAHRHLVDEECLVVAGVVNIGSELELHAGDFHVGRADRSHATITSISGATLYLRGAAPDPKLML